MIREGYMKSNGLYLYFDLDQFPIRVPLDVALAMFSPEAHTIPVVAKTTDYEGGDYFVFTLDKLIWCLETKDEWITLTHHIKEYRSKEEQFLFSELKKAQEKGKTQEEDEIEEMVEYAFMQEDENTVVNMNVIEHALQERQTDPIKDEHKEDSPSRYLDFFMFSDGNREKAKDIPYSRPPKFNNPNDFLELFPILMYFKHRIDAISKTDKKLSRAEFELTLALSAEKVWAFPEHWMLRSGQNFNTFTKISEVPLPNVSSDFPYIKSLLEDYDSQKNVYRYSNSHIEDTDFSLSYPHPWRSSDSISFKHPAFGYNYLAIDRMKQYFEYDDLFIFEGGTKSVFKKQGKMDVNVFLSDLDSFEGFDSIAFDVPINYMCMIKSHYYCAMVPIHGIVYPERDALRRIYYFMRNRFKCTFGLREMVYFDDFVSQEALKDIRIFYAAEELTDEKKLEAYTDKFQPYAPNWFLNFIPDDSMESLENIFGNTNETAGEEEEDYEDYEEEDIDEEEE